MTGARILVVDDEPGLREMVSVLLRRAGYTVETAANVSSALSRVASAPQFDLVLTDLAMPDGTGLDVLRGIRERDDTTQVVLITAYATTENAVEAMRLGAYDYVAKPFRNSELLALVDKALEKRAITRENRVLREQVAQSSRRSSILGKSVAMTNVASLVARVASARTSVLVTGESGTGKEVVARALHEESERASAPFVVVNCGAIPENLMESELFGHEKGAFTGATSRKKGLFEAASGGTLFLDEIGELPPALQVKLLRALQERLVRPVGAQKELEVDVRVVAATNRELEKDVEAGRFRQDLFYRLNVIRIHLPPLRDRPEDIPLLAEHFLARHAALHGKKLLIADDAMRWIASQRYPGNVRELENVIERAVTLALGPQIGLEDLPDARPGPTDALVASPELFDGFVIDDWLGELEKATLIRALALSGGNQKATARKLGTTFHSLRYRLRKYGLIEGEPEGGEPPSS